MNTDMTNTPVHTRKKKTLNKNSEIVSTKNELASDNSIKLSVNAENQLFEELARGERSTKEMGWMSVAESKRALGL